MAQDLTQSTSPEPPLFNSALETGVRAVVVLDAAYPQAFDLSQLTWLDHLVVHTADIGGPQSLHPDIPQRTGELLVRRRLVEDGLDLMRRLHPRRHRHERSWNRLYRARGSIGLRRISPSSYARELRTRAEWLAGYLNTISRDELAKLVSDRIGRWAVEFQGEVGPQGKLL
jgi:hypothetical protein